MLSYKQWKSINESVLPSFTLGLSNPLNLGIKAQGGVELDEAGHSKKKKDKEPEVKVDVKEDDEECKCGKKCGMKCGKMSKKKMWSDEDDQEEEEFEDDHDEDHDEEEEDDHDEDADEEEEEYDHDEDHDEDADEDHDEDAEEMKFSKKSKKKMLKGNQHKLDANHNGKIDAEDFKMLKGKKKKMGSDSIQKQMDYHKEVGSDGMPDTPAKGKTINSNKNFRGGNEYQHPYAKNMKKMKNKMKKEETEWWTSVQNMLGADPNTKFNDGWTEYQSDSLFTPVDTNSLTQAIRPDGEPAPGEVGFAPQGRMNNFANAEVTEAMDLDLGKAEVPHRRALIQDPKLGDLVSTATSLKAHQNSLGKNDDGIVHDEKKKPVWLKAGDSDHRVLGNPSTKEPVLYLTRSDANAAAALKGGRAMRSHGGYILVKHAVPEKSQYGLGFSSDQWDLA
jgi:hypothetical protein